MYLWSKGHAVVAGFVARDAELRQVGQNNRDKCTFSVKAYTTPDPDGGRGEAHWLNVVCWGDLARYAAVICKGDTVLAAGEIRERDWKKDNGEVKHMVELSAEFVQIQPTAGESYQQPESSGFSVEADDFIPDDGQDDDVPF